MQKNHSKCPHACAPTIVMARAVGEGDNMAAGTDFILPLVLASCDCLAPVGSAAGAVATVGTGPVGAISRAGVGAASVPSAAGTAAAAAGACIDAVHVVSNNSNAAAAGLSLLLQQLLLLLLLTAQSALLLWWLEHPGLCQQ